MMKFRRRPKHSDRIDAGEQMVLRRIAERELRAAQAELSRLRTENAILRAATAGTLEPARSSDDLNDVMFDAMFDVRRTMDGIGHVRPHQLPGGRWSQTEFEIIVTLHEVEALAMRVGARRLSVPGETMKS